jgi:hypothetical protein
VAFPVRPVARVPLALKASVASLDHPARRGCRVLLPRRATKALPALPVLLARRVSEASPDPRDCKASKVLRDSKAALVSPERGARHPRSQVRRDLKARAARRATRVS